MELTMQQINKIIHGAVRVERVDDVIAMFRFTREQEAMYRQRSINFHSRSLATAGVFLEMDTDSKSMCLSVDVSVGCGFRYFTHSIFVDGKRIGELTGTIPSTANSVTVEGFFLLGDGKKRVRIQFPWNEVSRIRSLRLDENSTICPVQKAGKLLFFGDSITQGYIANLPENAFVTCVGSALNLDVINKGIGGEKYHPILAKIPDVEGPENIVVAYGANDWNAESSAAFENESLQFCKNLRVCYPTARIIILAPIWDGNRYLERAEWPFRNMASYLSTLTYKIENLYFIDCFDFVPHDLKYYVDGIHPTDEGHKMYARNLVRELQKII